MTDPLWNTEFEWEADSPLTKDRLNEIIGVDSGGVGGNQSFMSLLINPGGRLTISSTDPTGSGSGGTLYYLPYIHTIVPIYNTTTTRWELFKISSVSIAVPAVTITVYDVHIYDNAGTPTLQLTAWTSDIARATSNVLQDGRYVLSTDKGKLYLGTFRTKAASVCTDNDITRYLWNMYNRVPRRMTVEDSTSHTYTATGRTWNADIANRLEWVRGYGIDPVVLSGISIHGGEGADSTASMRVGFGYNSSSVLMATSTGVEKATCGKDATHFISTPFGGVHDPGASDIGENGYNILEATSGGTMRARSIMAAAQVMA